MKIVQYKNTGTSFKSVLDVDDKSRVVKNVFNRMDLVDDQNDMIDKGAFNKTIKELGPTGANRIYHLDNHNALDSVTNAIGKFSELYVDGNMLVGVTNIANTTKGNDILELYKSRTITEHSIGFYTVKQTKSQNGDGDYNIIKEVMLREGSSVLWGANPYTPNLSVGKSLSSLNNTEKIDIFKELSDRLIKCTQVMSKAKLSDDGFALIEYTIKQIQTSLTELFETFTPADDKSLLPNNETETQVKKEDDELFKQILIYHKTINAI